MVPCVQSPVRRDSAPDVALRAACRNLPVVGRRQARLAPESEEPVHGVILSRPDGMVFLQHTVGVQSNSKPVGHFLVEGDGVSADLGGGSRSNSPFVGGPLRSSHSRRPRRCGPPTRERKDFLNDMR